MKTAHSNSLFASQTTSIENPMTLFPPSQQQALKPGWLRKQLIASSQIQQTVQQGREAVQSIINGQDSRLLVVVGPCSIQSEEIALEYASRLAKLRQVLQHSLEIIMRVYVEKPRTNLGWRGFLLQPDLHTEYNLPAGLWRSRQLMLAINEMGLPIGTELLDPILPPFYQDLLSWASIGARTTESQVHRVMASGVPFPIGFKNSTSGAVKVAADAVLTAQAPHLWMTLDDEGHLLPKITPGNPHSHVVLRGGSSGPNYDPENITLASQMLREKQLPEALIIDASHANSNYQPEQQPQVTSNIIQQIKQDQHLKHQSPIRGLMLESHLYAGKQKWSLDLDPNGPSLTDACLGWEETEELLYKTAELMNTHV